MREIVQFDRDAPYHDRSISNSAAVTEALGHEPPGSGIRFVTTDTVTLVRYPSAMAACGSQWFDLGDAEGNHLAEFGLAPVDPRDVEPFEVLSSIVGEPEPVRADADGTLYEITVAGGAGLQLTSAAAPSAPAPDPSGMFRSGRFRCVIDQREVQLRVIRSVIDTLDRVGVRAWLFGGWGLDARLGRITREHGDVEFWVERPDAERARQALTVAGATAHDTQPPEESCEFEWDGAQFSIAYVDRQQDGTFTPEGRWSDWVFPAGSFGDDFGVLGGTAVPAMSAAGMLAMKEQYPRLRNGAPLRPKDADDIETLRALVARR